MMYGTRMYGTRLHERMIEELFGGDKITRKSTARV